jgi:hypothetical protein
MIPFRKALVNQPDSRVKATNKQTNKTRNAPMRRTNARNPDKHRPKGGLESHTLCGLSENVCSGAGAQKPIIRVRRFALRFENQTRKVRLTPLSPQGRMEGVEEGQISPLPWPAQQVLFAVVENLRTRTRLNGAPAELQELLPQLGKLPLQADLVLVQQSRSPLLAEALALVTHAYAEEVWAGERAVGEAQARLETLRQCLEFLRVISSKSASLGNCSGHAQMLHSTKAMSAASAHHLEVIDSSSNNLFSEQLLRRKPPIKTVDGDDMSMASSSSSGSSDTDVVHLREGAATAKKSSLHSRLDPSACASARLTLMKADDSRLQALEIRGERVGRLLVDVGALRGEAQAKNIENRELELKAHALESLTRELELNQQQACHRELEWVTHSERLGMQLADTQSDFSARQAGWCKAEVELRSLMQAYRLESSHLREERDHLAADLVIKGASLERFGLQASALQEEGKVERRRDGERLGMQLADAQSETVRVADSLAALQNEYYSCHKNLATALAQEHTSVQEKKGIESQLQSLLTTLESERLVWGGQLERLLVDLHSERAGIAQLREDKSRLESQLCAARAHVESLQDDLAADLVIEGASLERLQVSAAQEGSKAEWRRDGERLGMQLADAQSETMRVADSLVALQNEYYSRHKDLIRALSLKDASLREDKRGINSKLQPLLTTLESERLVWEGQLERLLVDLHSERAGIAQLREDKTRLESQLCAAQAHVESLQDDLAAALVLKKTSLEHLRLQLSAAQEESIVEWRRDCEWLGMQLGDAQSETVRVADSLAVLQDQHYSSHKVLRFAETVQPLTMTAALRHQGMDELHLRSELPPVRAAAVHHLQADQEKKITGFSSIRLAELGKGDRKRSGNHASDGCHRHLQDCLGMQLADAESSLSNQRDSNKEKINVVLPALTLLEEEMRQAVCLLSAASEARHASEMTIRALSDIVVTQNAGMRALRKELGERQAQIVKYEGICKDFRSAAEAAEADRQTLQLQLHQERQVWEGYVEVVRRSEAALDLHRVEMQRQIGMLAGERDSALRDLSLAAAYRREGTDMSTQASLPMEKREGLLDEEEVQELCQRISEAQSTEDQLTSGETAANLHGNELRHQIDLKERDEALLNPNESRTQRQEEARADAAYLTSAGESFAVDAYTMQLEMEDMRRRLQESEAQRSRDADLAERTRMEMHKDIQQQSSAARRAQNTSLLLEAELNNMRNGNSLLEAELHSLRDSMNSSFMGMSQDLALCQEELEDARARAAASRSCSVAELESAKQEANSLRQHLHACILSSLAPAPTLTESENGGPSAFPKLLGGSNTQKLQDLLKRHLAGCRRSSGEDSGWQQVYYELSRAVSIVVSNLTGCVGDVKYARRVFLQLCRLILMEKFRKMRGDQLRHHFQFLRSQCQAKRRSMVRSCRANWLSFSTCIEEASSDLQQAFSLRRSKREGTNRHISRYVK